MQFLINPARVKRYKTILPVIFLASITLIQCGEKMVQSKSSLKYVKAELDKLAPVELKCDLGGISENDRQVLVRLVEAGRIIDQLFLRQVSVTNPQLSDYLQTDLKPENAPYLELFNIMFGPWNRLDDDRPFINKKPKPTGAGFYPEDLTKEELDSFIKEHPDQKSVLEGTFTVVKRQDQQLIGVPYHVEYADLVGALVNLLREAADLSNDPTLQKYLRLRADDLMTDEFFESDMAWMDLSGDLEVVIGPYEVYEDKLMGYKAAYEAFICVVDHAESAKLAVVSRYLNELEAALPLAPQYRNYSRGKISPVKVVQEVFSAGDTKAGIQTTAFNLPNDERVRTAKGSKKVMLKNVAQAKYEKCWIPIVNRILAEQPLQHVTFDAYFTHVLMHEVCHGLGPGVLKTADGHETTVSKELKDLYSTIEECKADVVGLFTNLYLIDKGIFPKESKYSTLASYLGGMFRSIRFGINEAHGGGVAIQFNYLVEKGAFYTDPKGKLDLNQTALESGLRDLTQELLLIEARGDYHAAEQMITKYRVMTPLMAKLVSQLADLPIDIRPSYPIAM